jgi:Skp family chaperone for outer membrane proteins
MTHSAKPDGAFDNQSGQVHHHLMSRSKILFVSTILLLSAGCSSMEYAVKEKFGIHKRDILVARVEDARESQDAAKEQFKTALEQFIELTGADGGELKARYDKLAAAYERSESRAKAVRDHIGEIETVAAALFREWEGELGQYSDQNLRRISERQLRDTQSRYTELIGVMQRTSARMDPVLVRFKDQVLFLKHNLNAQVIAQLGTTANTLKGDVARLITEMEASIREADEFISAMKTSPGG